MLLVYRFQLNKVPDKLRELCRYSNDLYNQANYIVRQEFIRNRNR